jgi:hypothetical protein
LAVLTLVSSVSAEAATFTVDSAADSIDVSPGDGACANFGGNYTLCAAVMEANALAGPDRRAGGGILPHHRLPRH